MGTLRFSPRKKRFARYTQTAPEEPICRARGYCGPFTGQEYYDMLQVWAGFGTCAECRRTVPVPQHGTTEVWQGWSAPTSRVA